MVDLIFGAGACAGFGSRQRAALGESTSTVTGAQSFALCSRLLVDTPQAEARLLVGLNEL
jgi:hypothetical protein